MKEVSLEKVEAAAGSIIGNLGYELVDTEFAFDQGRYVLRLYIDKLGGGINVDDCVLVSHAVEDAIEAEALLDVSYDLEVSSPGLNRSLRRQSDFEKYIGSEIEVKTKEPIDGRSNYKGLLETAAGGSISVIIDNMKFQILIDMISKARLVPKFEKGKKR
jgi:ribosome maturation factor RimP